MHTKQVAITLALAAAVNAKPFPRPQQGDAFFSSSSSSALLSTGAATTTLATDTSSTSVATGTNSAAISSGTDTSTAQTGTDTATVPSGTETATTQTETSTTTGQTVTDTATEQTVTDTATGQTVTDTATATSQTVTDTATGQTVTDTAAGPTVTNTVPGSVETKTITVSGTVKTVYSTVSGTAQTVTGTAPGSVETKTITVSGTVKTVYSTISGTAHTVTATASIPTDTSTNSIPTGTSTNSIPTDTSTSSTSTSTSTDSISSSVPTTTSTGTQSIPTGTGTASAEELTIHFPTGAPVTVPFPTTDDISVPFPTGTSSAPFPTGTGNSNSSSVAAWWGQTGGKLEDVCGDDSFSSVVLAFVNGYFADGGYPALNLGASTAPPSAAQKKAGANNLTDGTALVPAIKKCQKNNKKVFISLGGEAAEKAILKDEAEGAKLADSIWNLFLGGKNKTTQDLRPFGDVVLDGVDLDIENNHDIAKRNDKPYSKFVDQMRTNFETDKDRKYLISAAPQCPRNGGKGDANLSDELLKKTDIVWVQHYNNKEAKCNHGQDGFIQAVKDWSAAVKPAQLWIGAPGSADSKSASNGYADIATVKKEAQQLRALNLPNLGGWALWDAATAMNNSNYERAVADALKPTNLATGSGVSASSIASATSTGSATSASSVTIAAPVSTA